MSVKYLKVIGELPLGNMQFHPIKLSESWRVGTYFENYEKVGIL